MVSQRRLINLITMFILLSLFAVACERPLGDTGDETTGDQSGEVTDVNQGGGTDGDSTTSTDSTTDTAGETPADTDVTDDTETDVASGDTAGDAGDASDTTDDGSSEGGETSTDDQTSGDNATSDETSTGDSTADNATADGAATDDSADTGDSENQDASATTIPATHTVAAGENLYRIGLKYGISWVAIANENRLTNPNVLTVGQVLNLPGASTPTPTPSPQTETTYIVQPGDNLFRIGMKFGISWVQIAEANGLVNPNLIAAGDEIKIPVDAPGPAPAFSHVVKRGETLFLISLQYGVTWPTIAEANNLTSPYVIYVGQTLEIPGN